jgi:hypothetical protein
MKPAAEFLLHLELRGLFEVFVIPAKDGVRFQFFPYPETEKEFAAYLAGRFAHLGEPAECVFHPEIRCYDAFFRGLRFATPEEALVSLTPARPCPTTADGAPAPSSRS